ncbi:MAG: hypothetical protein J1E02_09745, partial [Coprobacter sp.]|nr:hypothetical protein [Coprobacter sp.]
MPDRPTETMCGIAGIAGEVGQMHLLLDKMIKAQQHRGHDEVAHWTDFFVDARIGLAHNRLETGLRTNSTQPFVDEETGLVTLLDGTIFNHKELKKKLSPHYTFRTGSMVEVLSKAWHRWGRSMPGKIHGNFTIAVYDRSAKHIFIVRDRLGIKPLYFTWQNGNFYFASEIKALFAAGVNRTMSPERWAEYLVHSSYGLPHETFWDGISQLPGGSLLFFNGFTLDIHRWYEPEQAVRETEIPQSEEELVERFQSISDDSIRRNITAGAPIGINLSGSIGSSLLLGLIRKNAPYLPIKVYSYYNDGKLSDDILWTAEMLSQTQYRHEQIKITASTIRKEALHMARIQDEPFDGLKTLAYAHLFRIAKNRGTTILCDALGLDETWGSSPAATGTPGSPLCLRDDFRELARKPEYPEPFAERSNNERYKRIFCHAIPRKLRIDDRISMAFSTELRKPFLDHRLVELAFAAPEKIKTQP